MGLHFLHSAKPQAKHVVSTLQSGKALAVPVRPYPNVSLVRRRLEVNFGHLRLSAQTG